MPLWTAGFAVADILLWKNKKLSASILAGITTLWFLLEVAEFRFVALLCYALLFSMLAIFICFRMAGIINWYFYYHIMISQIWILQVLYFVLYFTIGPLAFLLLRWNSNRNHLFHSDIYRNPPDIEDIKLSASACGSLFATINCFIVRFYEISTGKDLRLFFMVL